MITKETLVDAFWTAAEIKTIFSVLEGYTQEAPGRFRKGEKVAVVLSTYKTVLIDRMPYSIKNEKAAIKKLLK